MSDSIVKQGFPNKDNSQKINDVNIRIRVKALAESTTIDNVKINGKLIY